MSNDKAEAYQQGAAASLKLQRQMEAAGNTDGARIARDSVNANLDALKKTKK